MLKGYIPVRGEVWEGLHGGGGHFLNSWRDCGFQSAGQMRTHPGHIEHIPDKEIIPRTKKAPLLSLCHYFNSPLVPTVMLPMLDRYVRSNALLYVQPWGLAIDRYRVGHPQGLTRAAGGRAVRQDGEGGVVDMIGSLVPGADRNNTWPSVS